MKPQLPRVAGHLFRDVRELETEMAAIFAFRSIWPTARIVVFIGLPFLGKQVGHDISPLATIIAILSGTAAGGAGGPLRMDHSQSGRFEVEMEDLMSGFHSTSFGFSPATVVSQSRQFHRYSGGPSSVSCGPRYSRRRCSQGFDSGIVKPGLFLSCIDADRISIIRVDFNYVLLM